MTSTSLYIEKPQDEFGNRGYSPAVIEAEVVERRGGKSLKVLAPVEFAERWPTVNLRYFQKVRTDAGPSRLMDDKTDTRYIEILDSHLRFLS